MTICFNDYNLTNYNLYCPKSTDFILITNFVGSFKRNSPSFPDCLDQPDFISNSLARITTSLCGYCIKRSPCIFTRQLINDYNLFSLETYNLSPNQNSKPISIVIKYQCLDQSMYNLYSQSIYCTESIPISTTINYRTSIGTPPTRTTIELDTTSKNSSLPTTFSSSTGISLFTTRSNNTLSTILASILTGTRTSTSFIDYEYNDENVYCISRAFKIQFSKKIISFLLFLYFYLNYNKTFLN